MKLTVHALLSALILLAGSTVHAVIIRPLPIAELTVKADLVVQGIVTNKVCLRSADNRIYTRVDLRITDVIKGNGSNNSLSVVHGGGTIGNERQEVEAQVDYELGEEVVTFLVFNPRHQPVTIGLCQGKFDVWQDEQTGEKFACNPVHGSQRPKSLASSASKRSATPQSSGLLRLSDLKEQIQKASQ